MDLTLETWGVRCDVTLHLPGKLNLVSSAGAPGASPRPAFATPSKPWAQLLLKFIPSLRREKPRNKFIAHMQTSDSLKINEYHPRRYFYLSNMSRRPKRVSVKETTILIYLSGSYLYHSARTLPLVPLSQLLKQDLNFVQRISHWALWSLVADHL